MNELTSSLDENGDDHTVHTEHTSHDNGDDRSEDKLGLEDSDGDDTDTGFGSTVSGTEVGEHKGCNNTHRSEKDGLVGVTELYKTTESINTCYADRGALSLTFHANEVSFYEGHYDVFVSRI